MLSIGSVISYQLYRHILSLCQSCYLYFDSDQVAFIPWWTRHKARWDSKFDDSRWSSLSVIASCSSIYHIKYMFWNILKYIRANRDVRRPEPCFTAASSDFLGVQAVHCVALWTRTYHRFGHGQFMYRSSPLRKHESHLQVVLTGHAGSMVRSRQGQLESCGFQGAITPSR